MCIPLPIRAPKSKRNTLIVVRKGVTIINQMNKRFKRITVIVMDSVGIGALPDAVQFGDVGAHTLRHIMEQHPTIHLPHLQQLGLGNIASLGVLSSVSHPQGIYGKMAEISAGKDTMTGHWELMGLCTKTPFLTYPNGFPQQLMQSFVQKTGRNVLGNRAASGTEVIEQYGAEQMSTGAWIVYTSADSVLQIAAHEDVIPLVELYQACKVAREMTLQPPHVVGRVIARPYIGKPGQFVRTAHRHDYACKPPADTVLNFMQQAGKDVIAVGKINDIFSGAGICKSYPTKNNMEGIQTTIQQLEQSFTGLLFVNLVDFDSLYGHRRDSLGYASALEQFDAFIPAIMERISADDLLVITADHGNDPTYTGTDHTREYVPLLLYSPSIQAGTSLGIRGTYADVGATIADNFQVGIPDVGISFLKQL